MRVESMLNMIAGMSDEAERHDPLTDAENIALMKEVVDAFLAPVSFNAGDVVMLKPALAKHAPYHWPLPGKPAMVVETFNVTGIRNHSDKVAGTPHDHEILDMRIACKDNDGDFTFWAVDSRYFTRYQPQ